MRPRDPGFMEGFHDLVVMIINQTCQPSIRVSSQIEVYSRDSGNIRSYQGFYDLHHSSTPLTLQNIVLKGVLFNDSSNHRNLNFFCYYRLILLLSRENDQGLVVSKSD